MKEEETQIQLICCIRHPLGERRGEGVSGSCKDDTQYYHVANK
jgi:hypothetical protein